MTKSTREGDFDSLFNKTESDVQMIERLGAELEEQKRINYVSSESQTSESDDLINQIDQAETLEDVKPILKMFVNHLRSHHYSSSLDEPRF